MGIKNLNRYLLENCTNQSIQQKHLEIFCGKTIVIDTSIYLYKFLEEGELIENMYLMISVLLYYKIIPIFIFDGKPPKEKQDLLKKRSLDKKTAEKNYNELLLKIKNNETTNETKEEIQIELNKLKKQFLRIQPKDIESVKELMDLYGVLYIDAEGEADKICAKMVLQKTAWACLSDDMDMFVYGCTRIMRYLSLSNHTIMYYNLNSILRDLSLPLQEFREIIVLSGTDYNLNQKISLYKALRLHKEYKQANIDGNFYQWLSEKHIPNSQQLYDIYNMFEITPNIGDNTISKSIADDKSDIFIKKIKMNKTKLKQFLSSYGFIFL